MSEIKNNSFLHSVPNETEKTNNVVPTSSVGSRTSGNLSRGIHIP